MKITKELLLLSRGIKPSVLIELPSESSPSYGEKKEKLISFANKHLLSYYIENNNRVFWLFGDEKSEYLIKGKGNDFINNAIALGFPPIAAYSFINMKNKDGSYKDRYLIDLEGISFVCLQELFPECIEELKIMYPKLTRLSIKQFVEINGELKLSKPYTSDLHSLSESNDYSVILDS